MERRIFGLENEYGVTCTFRGQRRLSPDEVARYLFRRVVHWGRSSNVFLENGARLYLDVGSPPRVRHARVRLGRATWSRTTRRASGSSRRCSARPRSGCTRRASPATSTCSRTTPTRPATPTAATRTTWWRRHGEFARHGRRADPVLRDPADLLRRRQGAARPARRAVLHLPARRAHLGGRLQSATTRSRPIINTRDEPHADAERFRRLHVIVGDSNMSEFDHVPEGRASPTWSCAWSRRTP